MKRLSSVLNALIPVLALVFLVLIGGVFLGRANLFPSKYVDQTFMGVVSMVRWAQLYLPFSRQREPHLSIHDKPNLVKPSVDIGDGALTAISHYTREHGFVVSVIDRAGDVAHRWTIPDSVLEQFHATIPNPATAEMMRKPVRSLNSFVIQDDGTIVFNLTDVGLVKLDACSAPIWQKQFKVHHDMEIEPDGTIVALNQVLVSEDREDLPRLKAPYQLESVITFDQDGNQLDEKNLFAAYYNARHLGGFLFGDGNRPHSIGIDIMHTNDAEPVSAEFASHYDFINPGDLLISLRNLNMIAIIDRADWRVKWSMQGLFIYQHDPDGLPDGTISVYDNRTAASQWNQPTWKPEGDIFGSSRIVKIDPLSQEIVWEFEGNEDVPFYASVQGRHEWIGDDRVLIVDPEAGRMFEIDAETKQMVWEYWNVIEDNDVETLTGRIIGEQRLSDLQAEVIRNANCAAN